MIITIDGPAGSGKSTAARKLAARLEVAYLDTGAMYRAIALAAQRGNVDLESDESVSRFARSVQLEIDCGPTHARVRVNGNDVSEALRSIEVSRATSMIARHKGVRLHLVAMQREIAETLVDFVTEGRDQGSVVFPGADYRFVLDASVDIRAQRRHQEMVADGQDVSLEEVSSNIRDRDAIDAKQWAPLLESGSAIVLDTTRMTIAQVVNRLVEIVTGSRPGSSPNPG